jgi:SAM-dependent methyltransferase
LMRIQAEWLADARARLFRKAQIAQRKRVLDLGCGYGVITPELHRRSGGSAIALDLNLEILPRTSTSVCGDARNLPFRSEQFDLVFSQNVLLLINNTTDVVRQVRRILQPNGVWILFEPDYGGMMESPPETSVRDIWLSALPRIGADPLIGRKIPALLAQNGFQAEIELLPRMLAPEIIRFSFLVGLPLTAQEKAKLEQAQIASAGIDPSQQVCHLPYFLAIANRCR